MSHFKNKDEEILHWKGRCEDLEKELEEFRENSQLYERELESSLEQADKTIREFKLRSNRLHLEVDTVKNKSELRIAELKRQVAELEEENKKCLNREEQYIKYIRDLEQKNDDLERAHRAMYVSLGEFESKLNATIERNVLLESELDEKEALKVLVQRLKDEARDLKQEMQIFEREKVSDNDKSLANRKPSLRIVDSNQMVPPNSTSPLKKLNPPQSPNIRLSPLTRTSAMDIVGDLLRKVGALESKLASCRVCKDPNTPDVEGMRENHRARPLNRGISSPTINSLVRN